MADSPVPDGTPEDTPVVKVHYALASGREAFAVVALEQEADGSPRLPFGVLYGSVFLRDLGGELINLANIHRIEGFPEVPRSGD